MRYTGEEIKLIREHIHYDPKTGDFWWKKRGLGRKFDEPIGRKKNKKYNYKYISLFRKQYTAQRVAYICMGKPLPEQVDHINGDKWDNRWCNLRDSCRSTNQFNQGAKFHNKLGIKGVHWCKRDKKYIAKIRAFGKVKCLGYFDCPYEAGRAYKQAAKEIHGDYAYDPT